MFLDKFDQNPPILLTENTLNEKTLMALTFSPLDNEKIMRKSNLKTNLSRVYSVIRIVATPTSVTK